jgi:hypothetical protein
MREFSNGPCTASSLSMYSHDVDCGTARRACSSRHRAAASLVRICSDCLVRRTRWAWRAAASAGLHAPTAAAASRLLLEARAPPPPPPPPLGDCVGGRTWCCEDAAVTETPGLPPPPPPPPPPSRPY